jgi:short-subunit dehydrogenase
MKTAEQLNQETGQSVFPFAADMTDPEQAQNLSDFIQEKTGRLDILIANAGLSMRGNFRDCNPVLIDSMIKNNLYAGIYPVLKCWNLLAASSGRIVFISTQAALHGFAGVSVYSSAKMALRSLAESLSIEGKPFGISTGIIYPGFTENDLQKTVLDAQGKPFHHQRHYQMTQGQTAEAIYRFALKKSLVQILTFRGKLFDWFNRFFPVITHMILLKSQGTIHQVKNRDERLDN